MRAAGRKRRRLRSHWRIVPHTADVGLAVRGRTLRALFENAGRALCALASGDATEVRSRRSVRVAVRGSALDDLLVRWLQEILFLQETRGWRFRGCVVDSLDRRRFRVRGRADGERFDPARHAHRREIKAVTYHGLRIVRRGGWWRVRIILDV